MRQICFFTAILILFANAGMAQQQRAMTLEDVMNFHHIHTPSSLINQDGSWVGYEASPDRGDGYGVIVSADGETEIEVERGKHPRFSAKGRWALFTQHPPFKETEGKSPDERPDNNAVLIDTNDGAMTTFEDVRKSDFSESRDLLFVHHVAEQDTAFTDEENEKLEEAGTRLMIRDLESQTERFLTFVDAWSVDSMATTLVYVLKDTVDRHNGLYALSLDDISGEPYVLDTLGNAKFDRFTWYEETSQLAYMRAEDLEEDTLETAALHLWEGIDDEPVRHLTQDDAPEGYFLPFDNRLEWNHNGERLFFGLRPDRFAASPDDDNGYESEIDSLQQTAAVDVWHGGDPNIKTREKELWSSLKRQNLMSVYHVSDENMVWLADEELDNVRTAKTGDHVIATTNKLYEKRITWEGWFMDLYVINLVSGERTLVFEEHQGFRSLSPDGRHVLYYDDKHWHVYDVSTGEHTNLTHDIDVPFYSETHDRPSDVPGYRIAGWLDDGVSALIYDRFDIWRADLTTGEMQNITDSRGRDTETVLRIRKLDDEPHFAADEEVYLEGFNDNNKERAIYTTRLDQPGVEPLFDTDQNLRLRDLSADGTSILYTRESQDVYPDLWVTDLRFQDRTKVSNLQQQLEAFNWGQAELIEYTSTDGEPLQGIVIKPGDYDPSKTYPVFVYFYAKFSQRLHNFNQTVINHRPGFGYYASNDYVVFLPDIHFIEGRPGMSAVKSLAPAVQKIIDMGIADPDAIGLHGHSWSGYQTAYVVTQTDLFAAAIAGAPVSNMTSAYSGIRWGSGLARQFQYETGQSRIGSSLFNKRYLYIENSPVFYAHEINTPMLIMHGDDDGAVPWEQSIEMYLAMRRAGKDVVFLQYRDEPHHLREYSNKVDYTIRMKEYFDHYLKDLEAPAWIEEGVPYDGD